LIATPASVQEINVREDNLAPLIILKAEDDLGIETARLNYIYHSSTGTTESGSMRMSMQRDDLSAFEANIPVDTTAIGPGDMIEYTFMLIDFADHRLRIPVSGTMPFQIRYRLQDDLSVLGGLRASGRWTRTSQGWRIDVTGADAAASALVLAPINLPQNTERTEFVIRHAYQLKGDHGGNVHISTDAGQNWIPLEPIGGYPGIVRSEPAFTGATASGQYEKTRFDLSAHKGQQIRLRLNFISNTPLSNEEFWAVRSGSLTRSTADSTFQIPRTLELHANFPDPFQTSTTISFTLPETMSVNLDVIDLLGRRVSVLKQGTYEAGTYTQAFNRSQLAGGLYFLRLRAEGHEYIEKMWISP
jgi:hypothetical protein